jgi:AraC-like DNA-binding protein
MTNGPADGKKNVFSWEQVPAGLTARARYDLWRDTYTSRYGIADFVPQEDRPLFAECEFMGVGAIGVTRFDFSVQHLVRENYHIAADVRDDLLIGFNRAEPVQCRVGGQEWTLQTGDPILFTNAEPFATECKTRLSIAGISLPSACLSELVPAFGDVLGSKLDAANPATRHLGRYISFLLDADELGQDNALTARIETTLTDLLALAIGAGRDAAHLAQKRGLRAARLHTVLQAIAADFTKPDFSPPALARKLGFSPRYIQDLLQETGATFSERVLELRLQKARATLMDRRSERLKISEIAFACGFGDVSYFNQAFRRRFGCSPTQYRGGHGKRE